MECLLGLGTTLATQARTHFASTHLNPPLFAVWRDTVRLAYMPLDQTPNATPRPSDSTEETPRTSRTDSKDGDSGPTAGRPRSLPELDLARGQSTASP